MDLSKKVSTVPNICKVYLDFTGKSLAFNPNVANFGDTIITNGLIQETYFQKGSIQFSEKSAETAAGVKYVQEINISFNSSDADRAKRIHEMHNIHHVILELTNGETIVIGRNDYFQNKKPKVNTSNNQIKTVVEIATESMIPTSNYIGNVLVGLPDIIPLTFS